MLSSQEMAQAYYRALSGLYASDPNAALPLSHIWGDTGNMPFLRGVLSAAETAGAPEKAQLDAVPSEDPVTVRTIDLSVEWYDHLFRAEGIEIPPGIAPTAEQRRRAIAEHYPPIALGQYEHFHTANLIERACISLLDGDRRPLLVEIGAIYGVLSGLLIPRNPQLTYVFVDIPEALCITYRETLRRFPEASILTVSERGTLASEDLRAYDVVFVPAVLFDELCEHQVDIFAGFHTFGEMRNEYIAHYFRLVQERMKPRFFVSRNRYLNQITPQYFNRLRENMASVLCDGGWDVRHWDMEPLFLKCPYLDTRRHPRYLEFVLEQRGGQPVESVERVAKADLLRDVMIGGWVEVVATLQNPMVVGFGTLAHDLSHRGALFRLWDSVRRSPGRDNILVLLHLLDSFVCTTGRFHEEWFFYAGVLQALHRKAPTKDSAEILGWIERRLKSKPRAVFSPAPGFGFGAPVTPEPLPVAEVRQIMYAMADVDMAEQTAGDALAERAIPTEPPIASMRREAIARIKPFVPTPIKAMIKRAIT